MTTERFLVIGSNSFSGAHFVAEALSANHRVWGVSRSPEPDVVFLPYRWVDPKTQTPLATADNFSFQRIDLNHDLSELIKLIDRVHPSVVVNFSAQGMVAESWLNPTHWYKTNVLSQVALHEALRQKHYLKKYVHVTTPEVYGSTDGGWIKESNHFAPSTPYAVSRAACDLHLMSFHKAYGFPVVFTRAANVYGPGQQLYRIIPKTMLCARTGKRLKLHGGGESERSFIHIKDAMLATLDISLNAVPGSTWHISTERSTSIRQLVKKICELTGTAFSAVVEKDEERLGKDKSYLLDSTAVRNEFKWREKVSLEEGLEETIDWVDANLDLLKTLPWHYSHKE